jgi:hypothetical protein
MTPVLCTRPDSVYKALGADCFDLARDARTYTGTRPVVAHPPCRAFGRLAHFAKPRPDEKSVGFWCLETVRAFGGVLEHPAGSRLFARGFVPGMRDSLGGWLLPIRQQWFGHPARKDTWLYIMGCEPRDVPPIPLVLGEASRTVESQDRAARERTPIELARWLLDLAGRCEVRA